MIKVFLGDSFTSGENNNSTSFVNYIKGASYNLGVSGTTIGEYSIYPVDGNSLLSLISKHSDIISKADEIYLEYGINDVSAVMCGFASLKTVVVSFIKAIDWIKQLNPIATIKFLTVSNKCDIIYMFAKSQCEYLTDNYFKGYNFNFPVSVWAETYIDVISNVSKSVELVEMFKTLDWNAEIDTDGLHPNNMGYYNIAKNI